MITFMMPIVAISQKKCPSLNLPIYGTLQMLYRLSLDGNNSQN